MRIMVTDVTKNIANESALWSHSDRTPVNDTAYWMAACRASDVNMSGDTFAHLWLNEASCAHHAEYVEAVTTMENVTLSLRHRYFLEVARQFLADNSEAVFVNIGAGFTSYPFLLPENRLYIEVDSPDNVHKKQKRIEQLNADEMLPPRNIVFVSADLSNRDNLQELERTLKALITGKKSFFLLEGLVYYLPEWSTKSLLNIIDNLQPQNGSQLGLVTWNFGTFETPMYKRFEQYMTERGETIPLLVCHNPIDLITHTQTAWQKKELTNYKDIAIKFGYDPAEILTPENKVFWETISLFVC